MTIVTVSTIEAGSKRFVRVEIDGETDSGPSKTTFDMASEHARALAHELVMCAVHIESAACSPTATAAEPAK